MNNISIYNERMEKGMVDKLFFLNKIPNWDLIIDFGCGGDEFLMQDSFRLVHFFLKYEYIENWGRELKEDYFACMIEEVIKKALPSYNIEYLESYILPHIRQWVSDEFGYTIPFNTHGKLIFKIKKAKFLIQKYHPQIHEK